MTQEWVIKHHLYPSFCYREKMEKKKLKIFFLGGGEEIVRDSEFSLSLFPPSPLLDSEKSAIQVHKKYDTGEAKR
jgi:hypothetical protein